MRTVCFSIVWRRAFAACARLRNTRTTDSLRRDGTVCFSIVWRRAFAACARLINELEAAISRSPAKLHWFLDLRKAKHLTPRVSRTWTEWLSQNRSKLSRITALSPAALFPLMLTVASFQAGREDLLTIHREATAFRAALGETLPPGFEEE